MSRRSRRGIIPSATAPPAAAPTWALDPGAPSPRQLGGAIGETWTSTVGAGNLVVVCLTCFWDNTDDNTLQVDGGTKRNPTINAQGPGSATGASRAQIWVVSGLSAASHTFKINSNAESGFAVGQFAAGSVADSQAANSGSGTTLQVNGTIPAGKNALIVAVAAGHGSGTPTTPDSGAASIFADAGGGGNVPTLIFRNVAAPGAWQVNAASLAGSSHALAAVALVA